MNTTGVRPVALACSTCSSVCSLVVVAVLTMLIPPPTHDQTHTRVYGAPSSLNLRVDESSLRAAFDKNECRPSSLRIRSPAARAARATRQIHLQRSLRGEWPA